MATAAAVFLQRTRIRDGQAYTAEKTTAIHVVVGKEHVSVAAPRARKGVAAAATAVACAETSRRDQRELPRCSRPEDIHAGGAKSQHADEQESVGVHRQIGKHGRAAGSGAQRHRERRASRARPTNAP